VLLATGHHRNGILLAPITAQLVAELISGTAPTVPLQPFSYRRH
jgi:glycine/D-amino acid oxidase-like deaminating enzyme